MDNPFVSALAKALNIGGEELTELVKEGDGYKPEADKLLSDKIASHIQSVKEELKGQYDQSKENLVKKAVRETAERFEKPLAERFGVQVTEGEDIVEAVFNKANEWRSAKLDDEKVKSHPEYVKLISDAEALRKEAERAKELEEKYTTLQTTIERNRITSAINSFADEYWNKQEIVDYATPEMRANWNKEFKRRVQESANFKVLEDGRVIPVDQNGEVMKNELQHPISINEILAGAFEGYVPTKKSTDRGSSGGKGGGNGSTGYTGAMPKSVDDMNRILQDKDLSPDAKREVIEYCEKNNIL